MPFSHHKPWRNIKHRPGRKMIIRRSKKLPGQKRRPSSPGLRLPERSVLLVFIHRLVSSRNLHLNLRAPSNLHDGVHGQNVFALIQATISTRSKFYITHTIMAPTHVNVLLYIIEIHFSEEFLESYEAVTDWLYEKTLTPFYTKGDELPAMPGTVKQAFKDKRFAHLKMTEHSF